MASNTLLGGSGVLCSPAAPPHEARLFAWALSKIRGMAATWILIAVFLLALSPYVVSSVLMYPDEPQYVDAGVFMIQSNDWLMPACPNDSAPEDLKPILTYWIVALSYKLLGPSLAAARLPYLLAGGAVVWLTYRLTLLLTASATNPTGSRVAAALASALLLFHPVFWLCAIRCIPDVWLVLFLLMSAYGFIALLTLEAPTSTHAYLAYGGVSLAMLAKGVPALVFLGYVVAFAICNPWRPGAWRRLIHVPSMATGAMVAVSWFVAVFFTLGTDDLKLLWSDQVGTRTQQDPWIIAYRFPVALAALVLSYAALIWPLCKMGSRWRFLLPDAGKQRVAHGFFGGWVVLNLLAMCATKDWYIRYMLPSLPMLAVLLAIALTKVDGNILTHCFRRLLAGALAIVAVVGIAAIALAVQLRTSTLELVACTALVALITLAAYAGFRGPWLRSAQAIAASFLLMIPITYFSVKETVRPDLEAQIEPRLRRDHQLDHHSTAGFIGSKGGASRLRLALAPRVKLLQWDSLHAAPGELPSLLILPDESAAQLPAATYSIQPAASVFVNPQGNEWWRAIQQGELKESLLRHRGGYSIAVRTTR